MQNNYKHGEMFYDGILTSYRIYGNPASPLIPLIIIHGGPSGGFDYLLNYHELSNDGRMVIFYDQYGCGRSTHFPMAHASFWTIDRYLQQLQDLICHLDLTQRYALLGHSWGGMLAAEHACLQPEGLSGVIYASSPASIPLWQSEVLRLFKNLVADTDAVLDDAIMQAKIYQQPPAQLVAYYTKHVYSLPQEPLHIQRSNAQFAADPTAYHVLWGANELAVNGTLAQWDITASLHKVQCPGLVLHGENDQATSQVVEPLVTHISNCHAVTIASSSHNPHEENTQPCLTAVRKFLRGLD